MLKLSEKQSSEAAAFLLAKINGYQFDEPNDEIKFSDKLAREQMWSKPYTLRVLEEYKRFMFLAGMGINVTPSLEVDEAWHMHILYTRDYAEFCTVVLGRFIHHGPTRGGRKEEEKFTDWYGHTKERYEYWFGQKPPLDIWPPNHVRFRPVHFARVDLVNHWVIPGNDIKGCIKALWSIIKWKIKNLW